MSLHELRDWISHSIEIYKRGPGASNAFCNGWRNSRKMVLLRIDTVSEIHDNQIVIEAGKNEN